jgi:RNA-splicing ligase RtcB
MAVPVKATFNGEDLKRWGLPPGPCYPAALKYANDRSKEGALAATVKGEVLNIFSLPPKIKLRVNRTPVKRNIQGNTQEEMTNISAVLDQVDYLARVPTVTNLAVMPDACPAGIIPVGVVAETENAIHPGFHSADICCSLMASHYLGVPPKDLLDAVESLTHFGSGPRKDGLPAGAGASLDHILRRFESNYLLRDMVGTAQDYLFTQGDGNHFAFVGTSRRCQDEAVLVTHHGSRKPGADLYKKGMKIAKEMTSKVAEGIDPQASWIPFNSEEGRVYWEALHIIREWTRYNHFGLHNMIQDKLKLSPAVSRYWNEHNFIFVNPNNKRLLHAKGATPMFQHMVEEGDYLLKPNRRIIPLNMEEPILICNPPKSIDFSSNLGFAPHGAGRNFSRSVFKKSFNKEDIKNYVNDLREKIDMRFWLSDPDISELPLAYKNASQMKRDIKNYNLAEVWDHIDPYGSIMAGSGYNTREI